MDTYKLNKETGEVFLLSKLAPDYDEQFAEAWKIENRRIKETLVPKLVGDDVRVSTVFLVIDHNYIPGYSGSPVLFETMIFGGLQDSWCIRDKTMQDALLTHQQAVNLAEQSDE